MDAVWLQAVASKDSLFASQWPAVGLGGQSRTRCGPVAGARLPRAARTDAPTPEDAALVWGTTALAALFLVTLPAVTAGVALFVQLQIPRVFWLVDVVATIYAWSAQWPRRPGHARASRRRLRVVLSAVAIGRGAYIMLVERPERALFAVHLPDDAWHDAIRVAVAAGPRRARARRSRPRLEVRDAACAWPASGRIPRGGQGLGAGDLFARRGRTRRGADVAPSAISPR